jgi:hypothetical protein
MKTKKSDFSTDQEEIVRTCHRALVLQVKETT